MTYDEALDDLVERAFRVVRLAASEDGAPENALRKIAVDLDCLSKHRVTQRELDDAEALYRGAVQAGWIEDGSEGCY